MQISKEDVLSLARLARLHLDEGDVDGMRGDLNAILDFAARIQESEPDPENEAASPSMPLRDDTVDPWLTQQEAVDPAPDAQGFLFRVPPAMSGE